MNKIKVLRIIARLNVGGPAQHVAILASGLNNHRYETLLVYGAVENGEADMSYLLQNTSRREFLPELGRSINPFNDIKAFFGILKIIRRERPEIVHTHTAKAGTIGRVAAIIGGAPVKIHTFHGHVFSGYFNKFVTGYFLFIERILACFTDRIVAISGMQKTDLSNKYKIGSPGKFSIVKLGLDLDKFLQLENLRGVFRKKYNLGDDVTLIGIVGRLAPIKNHEMFIRAARLVKDRLPGDIFNKVKFIIVGDGPRKKSIMKLSGSLGLSDIVLFAGWESDTPSLYADLDIVALTSRNEGTPLSIIEALAAGKVVVATDVGGVRDVVGGSGFLVDKDDDAAFANALMDAIEMPAEKRREIRFKGREHVLKNYSKERLIRDMEKLYEELLVEKGIKA